MKTQSGIVVLRNLKTDRCFLFYADDIQKANTEMRFQLDLGMHPCKSLQEDYTNTGLEVFRFDTVELTDNPGRLEEVKAGFPDQYV